MPNTPIDAKRAKIKFWLYLSGMTRQELADKVKVHISSLNGWLSNKSIPDKRWNELKAIFEPEKKPPAADLRAVALAFTIDEHKDLTNMANDANLPLDVFIRQAMLEYRRKKLNGDF